MRISVRLDTERAEKLRRLVRQTGESVSEIVKRAIDLYPDLTERPYDVLMRSPFIGGGASGDPDFSTNYKQRLFER